MPALMDVTGERPSCMPKSKEESFLPVIGSNRSSQSSSQGDSPHNNNNHYPPSEHTKTGIHSTRCPSVAESLRLPSIDRSKTNSICSFTSNSTCTSRARRANSFHLASQPELCRSPSCPNLADLDNGIFTENETQHYPPYESLDHNRENKTQSDHHLSKSIKLPNIGKPKEGSSTTRRSNQNNNAERGITINSGIKGKLNGSIQSDDLRWTIESNRHISKSKSSSMRKLNDEFIEKEDVSPDPNTGRLRRSESMNSVHSQVGNQMPLLFPLRHNESRETRRSRKTVSSSRIVRASASKDTMKVNQLREVVEKLETLQSLEQEDDRTLLSSQSSRKQQGYNVSTPRHRQGTANEVLKRSTTKEVLQSKAIKDNYENKRKKQTNS